MASVTRLRELSPRSITYLVLATGLIVIAYTLIFDKMIILAAVAFLPLITIVLNYCIQKPKFSYLLYTTYIYYLTAIMRYSRKEGLSVVSDILLVFIFLSILLFAIRHKSQMQFSHAINFVTISYVIWILYILIQFVNPSTGTDSETIITNIRTWCLGIPVLYIVSSILLDNPKTIRSGLIIIGLFTLTAFLKLLYQKYRWFDEAETEWLMKSSWFTHILPTGIRYFSIFSDAGNFGSNMGMVTIVYGIVTFHTQNRWLRLFYLSVALMGVIGMFMSGTRGAIIVPLAGLALYCLISKSIKIMGISAIVFLILYSFFTFTEIGNDNGLIRRMRTAFTPTEDASFNVRVENQKKIAEYLETNPWGAGLGKGVERIQYIDGQFVVDNIPPDSYYVNIWMQMGNSGLIIYIAIYAAILLRCCYIIMFRIRDKQLRNILAALLCGVFGMWLNGYVGRGMGATPSAFMIAASLAFVMNGPFMDKQILLKEQKISDSNKKTIK